MEYIGANRYAMLRDLFRREVDKEFVWNDSVVYQNYQDAFERTDGLDKMSTIPCCPGGCCAMVTSLVYLCARLFRYKKGTHRIGRMLQNILLERVQSDPVDYQKLRTNGLTLVRKTSDSVTPYASLLTWQNNFESPEKVSVPQSKVRVPSLCAYRHGRASSETREILRPKT